MPNQEAAKKSVKSTQNKVSNPLVKLLWTGGFDSSYRVVQLSKFDVTIQPFYLLSGRKSEQHELNAISAITDDIRNNPKTKCKILPLIKVNISDIEPDNKISKDYHSLKARTAIGPQYDWLARFAKIHNGLELSVEKSDLGKTVNCVRNNGKLKLTTKGDVQYYVIDKKDSDADLITVMGNYHFPYPMFDMTKLDMLEDYKHLGFEETMKKTWFCHTPIKGEPCGLCHPCKTVITDGLGFRMTPSGLKRYQTEMRYGKHLWFKYFKKFRSRIKGY